MVWAKKAVGGLVEVRNQPTANQLPLFEHVAALSTLRIYGTSATKEKKRKSVIPRRIPVLYPRIDSGVRYHDQRL